MLGAQFLDAVDAAASEISKTPERWRIIKGGIRRHLLSKFPFGIYYRILPDHIRILAVKHHKRHPDYWMSRTDD